jgi:tetratricopeptide (TPR) repeat protein
VALRKAVELDKSNSDALLKLGQVLVAKGSADEAITTYRRILQDDPRNTAVCVLLGQIYESKKDWAAAGEMYKKALVLSPGNPLVSNNLAYVTVERGGSLDEALALAKTARSGMPDSPNVADTLGWIYFKRGAYRAAIDLFQEGLRLAAKHNRPESATIHYHLGLAYEKTGEVSLAKQHLEKVLKIDPAYGDAAEVKTLLAQLR